MIIPNCYSVKRLKSNMLIIYNYIHITSLSFNIINWCSNIVGSLLMIWIWFWSLVLNKKGIQIIRTKFSHRCNHEWLPVSYRRLYLPLPRQNSHYAELPLSLHPEQTIIATYCLVIRIHNLLAWQLWASVLC